MLIFKNILFTLVVPGTVTVVIPYLLLPPGEEGALVDLGFLRYAGLLPIGFGAVLYGWCLWHFTVTGRGTPMPIDPAKALVMEGPYRLVRNPMYLAVLSVLLGEVLLFEAPGLLIYTAIWFAVVWIFVRVYEEPALQHQFGETYERYCRNVPRWLPTRGKPYNRTQPL